MQWEARVSERSDAIKLANIILDRPNADPDDDLAILSRQFLRANDRIALLERVRDAANRYISDLDGDNTWYDRLKAALVAAERGEGE